MARINKSGDLYASVADVVELNGNAQTTLAISTSAAQTSILTVGLYDVWTDVECFIKVAATANDVTTSTGYILRTGVTLGNVRIPQDCKIGAIAASGTGTLRIHKVS